ncbi:FtsW/RodA/SpoVE family cell cycle protein [Anaerosporobacter faecicola]|uniref:FtsW/RodA/SpoVE family cell cycle protein n=1 Tax=Anaerosporobacter faecicola TaxID=2718714 RepID=UPI00143C92C6|nr:FtsW/RodA/SpoVE family cell cycle protein [Anaerosporobacter faecicola]
MDIEQYLKTVTEQIRCDKAKDMVARELMDHINDQKEVYIEEGIVEEEAYKKAVNEMGDPVEVGIALDRIHRPKMDVTMLILVLILSLVGTTLQYLMITNMGNGFYQYNLHTQIIYVIVGFLTMMLFCFIDYTSIGLYGKLGAVAMILLLLVSATNGVLIDGQKGYLRFLGTTISLHQLVFLYVPLFGGILYSYKNKGKIGFFKSCLWLGIPVLLTFKILELSLSISLFLIMSLQMLFVTKRGWFSEFKKAKALIITIIMGLPIAIITYLAFYGATYQKARLLSVINTKSEFSYLLNLLRKLLFSSNLIGKSTKGIEASVYGLPSDYIVTYIFSYYGIVAAIILLSVLGVFIYKVIINSTRQKNQLGLAIGIGCSLALTIQIILYVLVNLTILPTIAVYLPLFSYGGTGTIVTYALIGILMSIYRYQNVLARNPIIVRKRNVSKESSI